MATAEEQPASAEKNLEPSSAQTFLFQIWPPSQRTREAVINRLIATLSTPSILSKRYGAVQIEEATSLSRRIEEEAFTAAAAVSSPDPAFSDGNAAPADEAGIETLQIYSKEISKRMLEAVKLRATHSSASSNDVQPDSSAVASAVVEEASSTGSVSS